MSRRFLPGGIEVISTPRAVMWRRNGVLHREDGPAYERADGTRRYYRHGVLHREDGPAVVHPDGTCLWFRHGILCREDGPPVELGAVTREWYWGGTFYREKDLIEADGQEQEPDPVQIERMMEIIATFGFQEV
ncbi:MAG: hypothetical protein M0017_11655 [Desulfobacteraceae bacterium]|nr:hypothetical protein [Desulfobacteraceae bacterium]